MDHPTPPQFGQTDGEAIASIIGQTAGRGQRFLRRCCGAGPAPCPSESLQAKHGDVIVCATTACLRARLRTAPIRSRERQRADAQLLMTFCLIYLLSTPPRRSMMV